jgi:hypothetical protein
MAKLKKLRLAMNNLQQKVVGKPGNNNELVVV